MSSSDDEPLAPDNSGDGDTFSRLDLGRYIGFNQNGNQQFQLRIAALFSRLIKAIALGVVVGVVSVIEGAGEAMRVPATALSSFLEQYITAVFGVDGIIDAAFSAAEAEVAADGIAAFLVAIVVVGAVLVLLNLGVSQLE